MKDYKLLIIPLTILAVASISGCAFLNSGTVVVFDKLDAGGSFSPSSTTVKPGTTVSWENFDRNIFSGVVFTVTSTDGKFPSSGDIGPLNSYSYTFDNPGTYPYRDRYSGALGRIIVEETGSNQTTDSNQTDSSQRTSSNQADSSQRTGSNQTGSNQRTTPSNNSHTGNASGSPDSSVQHNDSGSGYTLSPVLNELKNLGNNFLKFFGL